MYFGCGMWCIVLVQCEVLVFVFDQNIGFVVGKVYCLLVECVQLFVGIGVGYGVVYLVIVVVQFVIVQVCCWQVQWGEQLVELIQWLVVDQCDCIFKVVVDVFDGFVDVWQQLYCVGVIGEFDEGVIYVQEQCIGIVQQWWWWMVGEVVGYVG